MKNDARSLLMALRPSFREGGDLANLAKQTEFDLDSNVLYLGLHQDEGATGRSETSLVMQVLFNAVYERAKGTDERVVFVVDEAHYLMNNAASLSFLETAVRHSRHYDLSLHFITQTGGEFALTPEARTIANLCSITLIHRVQEEVEKLAEWFGLSEREVNWVRTAQAGNDDDGYSETLLGIDGEGWFPLRVRVSEFEVRRSTMAVCDDRWKWKYSRWLGTISGAVFRNPLKIVIFVSQILYRMGNTYNDNGTEVAVSCDERRGDGGAHRARGVGR